MTLKSLIFKDCLHCQNGPIFFFTTCPSILHAELTLPRNILEEHVLGNGVFSYYPKGHGLCGMM